jgi:hypothetical protein
MHPGYIDYIKRVLRVAIEDIKVDLIHFDNTAGRAVAPTFHHPLAIQKFREYLKNKYSSEVLKERLGFSDVSYIDPPQYKLELAKLSEPYRYYFHRSIIKDPVFQEWIDFRCQQLADFYGIMEEFIHDLNPDVVIDNNPAFGLTGLNEKLVWGIDYPRLLSHTNYIWSEEGNEAKINKEGVLISKIRTFKMATTLNNRVLSYTTSPRLMAESMAYNRQIGMVGWLSTVDELSNEERAYIDFFKKNYEHYQDINNIADVAVLHSFASMAYNNDDPYQGVFLFEQTLIQEKIPFDIIFDNNLKDLSEYKVLVLADQECLSDEQLDLIRNFINKGGGLVATGNTSLYNEWRQRRREFGLDDLFKVKPENISNIPIQKNNADKKRIVYIPYIQPSLPKPAALPMSSQYWKLPLNRNDLVESIQWASGNNLSVKIEAPLTVTMELYQKEDKSAFILHLINFDSSFSLIKDIKVDLQLPEGKKVSHIIAKTPDFRDDVNLKYFEINERIKFIVPELSIYNLVVINLE